MSGHVKEHCEIPGTFMRREGSTWICDCGNVFKLKWQGSWGEWWKTWIHVGSIDTFKEKS